MTDLTPDERVALKAALESCYRDGEFVGSAEVLWRAARAYREPPLPIREQAKGLT